ncbi:MAG: hypothetical protein AAFR12_01475 [Cyanobacteria bacterium J06626_6]
MVPNPFIGFRVSLSQASQAAGPKDEAAQHTKTADKHHSFYPVDAIRLKEKKRLRSICKSESKRFVRVHLPPITSQVASAIRAKKSARQKFVVFPAHTQEKAIIQLEARLSERHLNVKTVFESWGWNPFQVIMTRIVEVRLFNPMVTL